MALDADLVVDFAVLVLSSFLSGIRGVLAVGLLVFKDVGQFPFVVSDGLLVSFALYYCFVDAGALFLVSFVVVAVVVFDFLDVGFARILLLFGVRFVFL